MTFFPNSLSWVRLMKIGLRIRSLRDSPRSQPCSLHPLLRCGSRRNCKRYEGIGHTNVQLCGAYCSGPMDRD